MRNLFLTMLVLMTGSMIVQAQTVTTFAGVENTATPWEDVDNSQVALNQAHFYEAQGITWDSDGNMYITERNKIRMVDGTTIYNRSGTLGDATYSLGYKQGTGNAAAYFNPTSAVCNSSREVFIVDSDNHAIRKLTKFGSIGSGQIASTFAGAAPVANMGTSGSSDGTGTAARFNYPKGITLASDGNFYVTDYSNHTIRRISATGVVGTLSGKAETAGSTDAGTGPNSRLNLPYGIAVLDQNNLVITDFGNSAVRKVNINTGAVTTIAGVSGSFSIKDGTLAEARFRAPRGIAVVNGLIYVADENVIRVIDIDNDKVSTFAGSSSSTANKDGVGSAASFGRTGELASDGGYTLYVTDIYYNVIKAITIDDLVPVADFTASKQSLEVNENTVITDISTGAPVTSRAWTIKDVNGSAANVEIVSGDPNASESLTVRFKAAGFYTVSLAITNDFGADDVVKVDYINVSVTGSVSRTELGQHLQIAPNPATGYHVTIISDLMSRPSTTIAIINLRGQMVASYENIGNDQLELSVSDFTPGVYFIEMQTELGRVSDKLIIQ